MSDEEQILDQYEETYKQPHIEFIPPEEQLVDDFLIEKAKGIFRIMHPKSEGGLDADWWTVVVGPEGVGKSTFVNGFLWEYSKIANLDFAKTVASNTAFDEFDIIRLIKNTDIKKPYQFIWTDEGANVFFNRSSNTRARKYTVKFSNSMRFLHYFVIICSVELSQLDVIFKNHRIKSLIRIENQGTYHYYNHRQLKDLMRMSKGMRDQDFMWHKIHPEHIGWFKNNDETKKVVDALKKNYLRRFQLEVSQEYEKMKKQRLTDIGSKDDNG